MRKRHSGRDLEAKEEVTMYKVSPEVKRSGRGTSTCQGPEAGRNKALRELV